nr:helix-turn-helix transcriptional regulator [Lachnospiraceae bacterium]
MGRSKAGKSAKSNKSRSRTRRIKSYRRAVTRASYNIVLYEARMKSGLSRRKFARSLKILPLHYRLMESGYLKPGRRTKAKVSAYLGEDYQPYCEGISSYPEDLPEKERLKISVIFFNMLGAAPFRVFLCLLIFALLGCLSYGIREYGRCREEPMEDASIVLKEVLDGVRNEGGFTLSPSGSIARYEVYSVEGNSKMVSIKADPDDSFPYNIDFTVHHWTDEGRLSYLISLNEDAPGTVSAGYSDYATNQTYEAVIDRNGPVPVVKDLRSRISYIADPALTEELNAILLSRIDTFDSDIEALIHSRLGMDLGFDNLSRDGIGAYQAYNYRFIRSLIFMIGGGCLALIVLFCLIYSLIYGTKNGVRRTPMTNYNLVRYAKRAEPKTDLRLTPFLPDTLLSLIGSTILLLSSMRIVTYAFVFIGVGNLDLTTAGTLNTQFMNYFYLGMFLLYFLDFDTFLDDMRVMGKIFMYLLLYLGLFALEYSILSYLSESSSPLYQMAAGFTPPNMFGTICLYFVIMLFLFFTPRFVRTRKRLLAYRLCSLIPVAVIFGAHVIAKGSVQFFGHELPLMLRLLLNEEKIAFSVLCVGYLFMLFFLRLFYEHRYGTENARRIFNGNRFIWVKNGLTCGLIVLIVAVNALMGRSARAVDFGWGQTTDLLLLIPLILFYHPHKGPWNRAVDALTMGYYLFALCFGYLLAAGIVLAGGL